MEVYLRKYFWVGGLVVIALCALFAAKALGQLVIGLVPAPKQRVQPVGARASRTVSAPVNATKDLGPVVQRNIFCAKCEALASIDPNQAGDADAADSAGGQPGEPVKSSLNLNLVATLVSDQDPAWSYAALFDPDQGKTGMYGTGGKVPGGATVTEVRERRVLLDNGGRAEYIDLTAEKQPVAAKTVARAPDSSRARKRSSSRVPDDIAAGVRSTGPNKWEIRRGSLNKVLSNTTMLARSARIIPSVRNGKPNGFRLHAIRDGSIYSLIGMQNGDTINAINGRPMTTPDKALEVYTKLRNAGHLSISFTRRGKPVTHDYTIR